MPTILQLRRGSTAENDAYTGSVGEITVDTTLSTVRLHDGSTAGGSLVGNLQKNIQLGITGDNEIDTSSGNLIIDSAGGTVTIDDNLNISGTTTVSGHILPDADVTYDLGSSSFKFRDIYLSGTSINLGDATITASGSSIVLPSGTTVSGGSGATVDLNSTQTLTNKTLTTPVISSISNTGTLTLPTSTDTLVGRATTDTLTNKTLTSATLTSPVINTGVSGTAFLDDDTFATATASTLASSESIKAYVDTTVAATNEVVEDTTPQLGGDLDLNSNDITGTGDINITGTITSSGNITGTLATAAQPNITSVGTLTGFTSTGIDDNATSTAITIDSSENVGIGTTSPSYELGFGDSSGVERFSIDVGTIEAEAIHV